MPKHTVKATIVEIRGAGSCPYGHKVGDSFHFGDKTPSGLCHFAHDSLHSAASVILYGGRFPWAKDGQPTTWSCPDPDRPVIFSLERVPAPENK